MTQWNEILTNTGKYKLLGQGGAWENPGNKYVLFAHPGLHSQLAVNAHDPSGVAYSDYDFVESNGGRLALRQQSTGKSLLYDGQHFVPSDADATHFVPDEIGGNVVLRFRHENQPKFLAMKSAPFENVFYEVVASSDPSDPNEGILAQWMLCKENGPVTELETWLHTYVPENRFSPLGFLEHVRLVITGADPIHNDANQQPGEPGYLDSLTDPLKESIETKISNWRVQFAASSALERAEANGAMLLASARFYLAPTSEFNELDPDRPPDWPGLDDELGGDPYPG